MNESNGYFYLNSGELDLHLFHEGTAQHSYEFLGAHPVSSEDLEKAGLNTESEASVDAVRFTVWAPNAKQVFLIGDFNDWRERDIPMERLFGGSVWHVCVPNVNRYDRYKYHILSAHDQWLYKADPFAFHAEERPHTASKYYALNTHAWGDAHWMEARRARDLHHSPMSIYEVNLMSWRRKADGAQFSYRDLAKDLVAYVKDMGFTHIELMPIMEHPYDGSWGYQLTGYYAPTSRYGTPGDFMALVDACHQNGIGVILDWVPCHYCRDDHGLYHFDGGPVFESAEWERAHNDQWGTINFDYARPEVHAFLMSNIFYWTECYHIDGFRMDAVAYMLYLNFGGKRLKNKYGSFENLDAVRLIQKINGVMAEKHPDVMMIAEESTAWPNVTGPLGAAVPPDAAAPPDAQLQSGLGFTYKWNMGWMNDILEYMKLDPIYRKGFHKALTFTMTYAFAEAFILPLSHDEVVHGKRSLLEKMPGGYGEKFANLRLLLAYMFAHPGKKLLFMGGEFGQFIEWNEWQSLDWHLLDYDSHRSMLNFVKALNHLYLSEPCLYECDTSFAGYEWIEVNNADESVISFERLDAAGNVLIAVFNFTPVPRKHHPIGVRTEGTYTVVLSTDDTAFGGTQHTVPEPMHTVKETHFGRPYALLADVPPLGALFIKYEEDAHEGR